VKAKRHQLASGRYDYEKFNQVGEEVKHFCYGVSFWGLNEDIEVSGQISG